MSCFENTIQFVGRFISEFMRLILFFASIIFLLVSTLLLLSTAENKDIYARLDVEQSNSYFYVPIGLAAYLIILGLCGFFGSFFRSSSSMQWFSLLASLNVLVGLVVYMYISPKLEASTDRAIKKLENLQLDYDWLNKTDSSDAIAKATSNWNTIQSELECCGISSPDNWISFRLKDKPDTYPASCCKSPTRVEQNLFCYLKDELYKSGCFEKMSEKNSSVIILLNALIWLNLILSVMACIVIFCGSGRDYEDYN